jgi:uncharacterized protein with GYD domain
MPKYLVIASYTSQGIKGLMQDGGSGRRKAVEQVAQSVGASVESFHFAFGDDDVYIVVDAPDNVSAVTASLVVNASGAAQAKTVPLLTAEEMDEATQKSADYRPPGA